MTALVGWDVHMVGLADLRQVVLRGVPEEGSYLIRKGDEVARKQALELLCRSSANKESVGNPLTFRPAPFKNE